MKEQVIKVFFPLLNMAISQTAKENIEKDAFSDEFVKALFSLAKKQDLEVSTLGANAPINLLMNQLMIEKIATIFVWLG